MKSTRNINSKQPLLKINMSGKQHYLTVEQAFSLAHQLVCHAKLDAATSILDWLEQTQPNDRRVKVLHARCLARLGQFAECNQLLNQAYPEPELEDVAGSLQTALVYRATGLLPDAREELKQLCSRHPELPSLWLMAGDLWHAVGRPDQAAAAWRSALQKDDDPKLIATAAAHRIRELAAKN